MPGGYEYLVEALRDGAAESLAALGYGIRQGKYRIDPAHGVTLLSWAIYCIRRI
jgi:hypothetical protein